MSPARGGAAPAPWVVFLVTSTEQLQAARAVAEHLPGAATLLDPYHALVAPLADVERIERPVGVFPTPGRLAGTRRTTRQALAAPAGARPILVVGQDEGTLERVAVTTAKRLGAAVVILPDGVRTTLRFEPLNARTPASRAFDVADRLLVAARVLSGRRTDFGSTRPDAILGWGPGWQRSLQGRAPGARIVSCGSPRSDALAGIPPRTGVERVLICSQPLLLPPTEAPVAESLAWYDWLARIAGVSDPRARVRLHPSERSPRYALPAELETLARSPAAALRDDLAWADVVVAPYSSILVEAVAAGRIPVSAGGTAIWGRFAANAFLEDPRVARTDFRADPDVGALLAAGAAAAPTVASLRDDYMAHVGDSARRAAEAIASA